MARFTGTLNQDQFIGLTGQDNLFLFRPGYLDGADIVTGSANAGDYDSLVLYRPDGVTGTVRAEAGKFDNTTNIEAIVLADAGIVLTVSQQLAGSSQSGFLTINGSSGADSVNGQPTEPSRGPVTTSLVFNANGGADSFVGGQGDDRVRFNDANRVGTVLDGRGGFDTLVYTGNDTFDFASLADIRNFEGIELRAGDRSATLILDNKPFATSDSHAFTVRSFGADFIDARAVAVGETVIAYLDSGRTADNTEYRGGDNIDRVFGGGGADTILTGAGDDFVDGGAGNDRIDGGVGNDILNGGGGGGGDSISGGEGNDTLYGVDGQDSLNGDAGDDILDGGNARDFLFGGTGNDTLIGGDGDDLLRGGDDNDVLQGDLGNDEIYGEAGNDTIEGGVGDDALFSGSGDDTVSGGAGDDYIESAGGADTLLGAADDDEITIFGDGFLLIDGGSGLDELHLDGAGSVLDLTLVGNDQIVSIEEIGISGTGDNTLILSDADVIALSETRHPGFDQLQITVQDASIITGNAGDSVELVAETAGGAWSLEQSGVNAGGTLFDLWAYDVAGQTTALLAISSTISVTTDGQNAVSALPTAVEAPLELTSAQVLPAFFDDESPVAHLAPLAEDAALAQIA